MNNSDQNILKIKIVENSEEAKEENNKIITHRINVINKNLGDETNRANKNSENSEHKEIQEEKQEGFERIAKGYTKKFIKLNFQRIKKREHFNCLDYLYYMLYCKKIKPQIQYYENLRRLIISEEIMFQNYLNIYKLLEIHHTN